MSRRRGGAYVRGKGKDTAASPCRAWGTICGSIAPPTSVERSFSNAEHVVASACFQCFNPTLAGGFA
eukprot:5848406-Pyramimonas_sp.AAC.2